MPLYAQQNTQLEINIFLVEIYENEIGVILLWQNSNKIHAYYHF